MSSHARMVLSVAALLTLAPAAGRAQADTTLYMVLDYMKATSADYAAVERDIWKPIHEARVAGGEIESWTLYWVRFGDRTEYDYVVANVYRGMDKVGNAFANADEIIAQVHPDRDPVADNARTQAARQMVRSEVWSLEHVADDSNLNGPTLAMAYMRVPAGGETDYLALEEEVWQPLQEERIRRGTLDGWAVYQLQFPGGTEYPYGYAATNTWSTWGAGAPNEEIAAAVHPDVVWADAFQQTLEARDMVGSEVWQVVEHAGME